MLCVLVLGACQQTVSPVSPTNSSTHEPTVTATATPLRPGVIEVVIPTLTPTASPASAGVVVTSMANTIDPQAINLVILLDRSKSMKDCENWLFPGNNDLMSQRIIQFLYTLFVPLGVGVHPFYLSPKGSDIEEIPLVRTDGLITLEPPDTTDNHYLSTLQSIHQKFNENYVVLMISDGAFNDTYYTGKRDDTRKWLEENVDFSKHLYVIQPSNSKADSADVDMWHAKLENRHIHVDDRKNIGTFLRDMIKGTVLKEVLPDGGWFEGDENFTIPGNALRASAKVWGIWENPDKPDAPYPPNLKIKIDDTDVQISILPSIGEIQTPQTRLYGPKPSCDLRKVVLHSGEDRREFPITLIAFYLIEIEPSHQQIISEKFWLFTGTQFQYDDGVFKASETIWNPQQLYITEFKGLFDVGGGMSEIADYQECYTISAEIEFFPQFSADGKTTFQTNLDNPINECFMNKKCEVVNSPVIPFLLDKPGSIDVRIFLKDVFTDEIVKTWKGEKDIRFFPYTNSISTPTPVFSGPTPNATLGPIELNATLNYVDAKYYSAGSEFYVYALAEKKPDNENVCGDTVSISADQVKFYILEVPNRGNEDVDSPITYKMDNENITISYKNEGVLNQCGYQSLVFQYHDGDLGDLPVLKCNVISGLCQPVKISINPKDIQNGTNR